jgi:hypothetical protein
VINSPSCEPATVRAKSLERGIGMPDKELTVAQRATLLALMIRAGAAPRTFLADTVKISLDKAKRDDLVTRGLIVVTEKPLVLELTEDGWGRAIQEMAAELPPRGGALGGTLYLLLDFLRGYLDHNDLSAAGFFASRAAPRSSDVAPVTPDIDAAGVETQIRKAYGTLATKPGAYVMLEDLRESLGGASRAETDATLVRLDRAGDIHLIPESNQKVLTAGQRAAALRIGTQDMHLLAIRT